VFVCGSYNSIEGKFLLFCMDDIVGYAVPCAVSAECLFL